MKQPLPSTKTIAMALCSIALILSSLPNQLPAFTAKASSQVNHHDNVMPMANDTQPTPPPTQIKPDPTTPEKPDPTMPATPKPDSTSAPTPKTGPGIGLLQIRVIDGRTKQPLEGAEVVVIETEKRYVTDKDGLTTEFQAPIFRNPKYRPLVAELHGQLGVVVYKNGYRDSVHLGIRMHDGVPADATVWMYKIEPGDRRIEPVLYQVPYHHLWLIELADRFRQKSQIGEGPEHP